MSTQEQIRSFAARIERLDEEIKSLNSDKKEVYSEMKAHAKKTVDAETFWFKIVPMPHKSPGFKEDFEKLRKAAS